MARYEVQRYNPYVPDLQNNITDIYTNDIITKGPWYDVRAYGAKGDGTTDDTSAIQAALTAAAGGVLFFPKGVYLVSTELAYDTAALGGIVIRGVGDGSILKASGVSNAVLHISGTAGVTSNFAIIDSIRIESATSGTSVAGIHLDGIARLALNNVGIDGKSKMAVGIKLEGAQQGEISGGYVTLCTTGIELKDSGTVSSNGIDLHGVSFANSGTNLSVDGVDTLFCIGNHMTSAAIGIDVLSSGTGVLNFIANHLESHSTSGIRVNTARANIIGNSFFPAASGTDLALVGAQYCLIQGNLFNGNLTFDASTESTRFVGNTTGNGTFTDSSSNMMKLHNRNVSGSAVLGTDILDSVKVISRDASAGHIIEAKANPTVGGAWGVRVAGAGVNQDVYLQLNDVTLNGSTSGGRMVIKSGVGGTEWMKVTASGLTPTLGVTMPEGKDIALGTTTGSKIGTAATEKLGFYGATPVVQPAAYTLTNVVTDRSYDANATTTAELADVLGTLIADLQSLGLIG